MQSISTGSWCFSPMQYPISPSLGQRKIINDTKSNNVFLFPVFLSVSVGVMLTPVAQDLAFLMTPSCQVFIHNYYCNKYLKSSVLQTLPSFSYELQL